MRVLMHGKGVTEKLEQCTVCNQTTTKAVEGRKSTCLCCGNIWYDGSWVNALSRGFSGDYCHGYTTKEKVEVKKDNSHGRCGYCSTRKDGTRKNCQNCGAPI